ncbi:hypothetical protein [Aulosira sp. FACHB-615]|uniref:hypothetical protein n=1 Tax=Aulosira sp. FACHB-615 TaxID=2692777 RepID=UPI0016857A38|nr:hypothetical protein [Aulosira sp. FACHB-615]MBD2489031.1 hypothetical protein [Aulosira sp. FACHB-615]
MTSPFSGFDNTTLTFQIADGSHKANAIGNYIPLTIPVIIKALLKQTTDTSAVERYAREIQQFAGADGYASLLEGYLVAPVTYPKGVEFLMEADAEIIVAVGKPEKGRFKLLPITQSPYLVGAGVDIVTPIKGIFRRN